MPPSTKQTEIAAVRAAARTIEGKPALNKSPRAREAPSALDIVSLPVANAGVYELSDAEVKKARQRIYALNKENAAGWRWRTLREFPLLLVWRIN